MSNFLTEYQSLLAQKYPSLRGRDDLIRNFDHLISDQIVPIPAKVYSRIQNLVQKIFNISRSDEYQNSLKKKYENTPELDFINHRPQNTAVLMAYDFHYEPNSDKLSLIEINTNASSFLLVDLLYELGIRDPVFADAQQKLKDSFSKEMLALDRNRQGAVTIIDENILKQKMYVEFLMYQDLFRHWGWDAKICEFNSPEVLSSHFVYNRHTDFYLQGPEAQKLRELYLQNKIVLSPNPREYLLLADKARFLDFYSAKVGPEILITEIIDADTNTQRLWERRKNLIFKPRNLFGSKAVYRGSSVSRKYFDELVTQKFIAQEYAPTGEFNGWKFDLRFYVYEDQIQLGCARLYKGQVTNFLNLGGGLARVSILDS